jgi:hypothetical protein
LPNPGLDYVAEVDFLHMFGIDLGFLKSMFDSDDTELWCSETFESAIE